MVHAGTQPLWVPISVPVLLVGEQRLEGCNAQDKVPCAPGQVPGIPSCLHAAGWSHWGPWVRMPVSPVCNPSLAVLCTSRWPRARVSFALMEPGPPAAALADVRVSEQLSRCLRPVLSVRESQGLVGAGES